MYTLNDREVGIIDIDFESGEGVWVIAAEYVDNGQDLTEAELEELTNTYQSELYQAAYEDMASRAYDQAKDFMKYGE